MRTKCCNEKCEMDVVKSVQAERSYVDRRLVQTNAYATNITGKLVTKDEMIGIGEDILKQLIISLIGNMINCFNPDDGPQVQQYVMKRYDENDASNEYRGYDKRLVKSVARRVKDAARKNGMRFTWDQAYVSSFETLDSIRTSDPHQISVVIAEDHNFMLI